MDHTVDYSKHHDIGRNLQKYPHHERFFNGKRPDVIYKSNSKRNPDRLIIDHVFIQHSRPF